MQVTGYAKVWFPFHLIRNHFICWNSTALLMSISRSNWFWRCAHIRLFYILYYTAVSGIEYRAKGTIEKILLYDLFHRRDVWKSVEMSIRCNQINVLIMIAIRKRDKRRCYKYCKNDELHLHIHASTTYETHVVLKHDAEMSTNYFSVFIMWKTYLYGNVFTSRYTQDGITMN